MDLALVSIESKLSYVKSRLYSGEDAQFLVDRYNDLEAQKRKREYELVLIEEAATLAAIAQQDELAIAQEVAEDGV